jgi:hypothetical protein
MKVKVEYKNKKLDIVNVNEYDFVEYCNLMSKRVLGILYKYDNLKKNEISYEDFKKYIFNVAGNIKRIPDNIKGE